MVRDVIYPQCINEFKVKIDNTRYSSAVKVVRLSLVRTVFAGANSVESIKVCNEEVCSVTNGGGAPAAMLKFDMQLITPTEVNEKHMFNTDDGRTQFGSLLAPTFKGKIIEISYAYELRIWHHASFGSDSV